MSATSSTAYRDRQAAGTGLRTRLRAMAMLAGLGASLGCGSAASGGPSDGAVEAGTSRRGSSGRDAGPHRQSADAAGRHEGGSDAAASGDGAIRDGAASSTDGAQCPDGGVVDGAASNT